MVDKLTLDAQISTLQEKKSEWANLPLDQKIALFESAFEGTYQVAQNQVDFSVQKKQIPKGSHLEGEEWFNGPVVQLRTIRLLIDSLKQLQKRGSITLPNSKHLSNGQLALDVFPLSILDKILFADFRAEVWMDPSVNHVNLEQKTASFYQKADPKGSVCCVLGAGNVASIGPLDVIHKLAEGKVVALKMNPVNDYLGPFIEQTFAEFIKKGYVKVIYGGAQEGEYLCQHPQIEEIHITGSDKTHDIICYGFGEDGQKAKLENRPRLDKPITSELGNITPIIVTPGPWTKAQMQFHAENIATQLVNNAGFNCLAARVIVLHNEWPLKDQFMQILGDTLEKLEPRKAYYPGAKQRYEQFCSAHRAQTKVYGQSPDSEVIPWTIIQDLTPDEDSICYQQEAFCGIMAQTNISAKDTSEFLQKATQFCNEKVWGTLDACLIIDPNTQKHHQTAFEQAISDLKYGAIGVNQWPALLYGLGSTTWGAFPGHTWDNIQSGQGVVHNTFLLDNTQKSVLFGPFTTSPFMPFQPPWFASNKAMPAIAKAMMEMEHAPSIFKLPSLIFATLQGVWHRQVSPFFNFWMNKLAHLIPSHKKEHHPPQTPYSSTPSKRFEQDALETTNKSTINPRDNVSQDFTRSPERKNKLK